MSRLRRWRSGLGEDEADETPARSSTFAVTTRARPSTRPLLVVRPTLPSFPCLVLTSPSRRALPRGAGRHQAQVPRPRRWVRSRRPRSRDCALHRRQHRWSKQQRVPGRPCEQVHRQGRPRGPGLVRQGRLHAPRGAVRREQLRLRLVSFLLACLPPLCVRELTASSACSASAFGPCSLGVMEAGADGAGALQLRRPATRPTGRDATTRSVASSSPEEPDRKSVV